MDAEFTDERIYELFGSEAAEDEVPERLKSYFYRNRAFDSIRSNLPLRILVGHKGVGKSALLNMSRYEDRDQRTLSVQLQPNDIHDALRQDLPLIKQIEELKISIARSIFKASLAEAGIGVKKGYLETLRVGATQLLKATADVFEQKIGDIKSEDILEIVRNFINNRVVFVYIDDVDRAWQSTQEDIRNIAALLNACRDLSNEDRRIRFRIGLRTDAYFLFRTSDASADKVDGSVVRLEWSNHEILVVVAKRVARAYGVEIDEFDLDETKQLEISRYLYPVITERFEGVGKWANKPIHSVLLSFVRRRPRDMVALLKDCAQEAGKKRHKKITTVDIQSILPNYSSERINDLVVEFRSELPDIERLLVNMRPTKAEMSKLDRKSVYEKDELIKKLANISQGVNFKFSNGQPATPQNLANFLYKIDFIIARREVENGVIDRKFFDQNRLLQSQFVDFGYAWEVHPAYRWALQPYDAASVLQHIDALA